ncbi:FadR/GntR family transcriptional regulator [Paenibacillus ginsengihumi]|uniref:FadR/GntR family transcriptional regulator n=1 Tax=Paenibacillus ginsengihumi TaxID=431596 RepID=UPI0003A5FE8D|nr:FadR/GntR family transcriptional regulator [Paenibacillus ginsengihumi]
MSQLTMSKKLTYETVYEEIKRKIQTGVWRSGDRLPPLEQLAEELGVGVSSVREAVRVLGKQKILRIEQGRGTYVEDDLSEQPQDRLAFLEQATMLQLTEARLIIEPELASLAAEKATPEEVEAIVGTAEAMKRKVERRQDFFKEDVLFHELIAKASHNEIMQQMLALIGDLLTDSRRRSMKWPGMDEKASAYHHLIARAIAERNPTQARTLMRSHLEDMKAAFEREFADSEHGNGKQTT